MPPKRKSQATPPPPDVTGDGQSIEGLYNILGDIASLLRQQVQTTNNIINQRQVPTPQGSGGGDVLERFRRLRPPVFKGQADYLEADNWKNQMEKLFDGMRCTDEDRVVLAVYMLEGEVDHW